MTPRKGEKIGWTFGWFGGFLWIGILAVVFLFQRKWLAGALGLVLLGIILIVLTAFAPWRHPATPFWKLMLPLYAGLAVSIIWAVRAFGGLKAAGLRWWNVLWLWPLFIPLGTTGRKCWRDGEDKPGAPAP
jgi:peptidoglycan/LPS O-acetylase OafA/YrhL